MFLLDKLALAFMVFRSPDRCLGMIRAQMVVWVTKIDVPLIDLVLITSEY
jgi:hypothetical protein